MIALKKILVATDFGEAADAALLYARALARNFNASIDLLHVVENVTTRLFSGEMYVDMPVQVQRDLEDAARAQLNKRLVDNDPAPLPVNAVLITSNATAAAVVEYAKKARTDLIVIGTHGHTGLEHLLMGSVAERIVRTAACPVLVVRHPEHELVVPDTLAASARA
jgi:nucleotide-binding universal stress UspA family protein